MAKRKAKEPPVREWIVPMRCEYRESAIVEGRTAEEAIANAKGGSFDVDTNCGELINWEVTGTPEENV